MSKEKGPLLFIDSITVINEKKNEKKVYINESVHKDEPTNKSVPDAVEKDTEPKEESHEIKHESDYKDTLETRKLNNIIEMYKKNRPVLCSVVTQNEEIVGVPYLKDENNLTIKVSETEDKIVCLHDISEISIIKF